MSAVNTGQISDGYHTFDELYQHRIELWKALCRKVALLSHKEYVWRSHLHSDGTKIDGWFVLGMSYIPGEQITYHLRDMEWDNCNFAYTYERAPDFDGHTSSDVLERLRRL